MQHLAGVELGFTDYLSRNASGEAEPESHYDEKFIVASIDAFFNACNIIRDLNPEEKSKPKDSKQIKSANFISKIPAVQAYKTPTDCPAYSFALRHAAKQAVIRAKKHTIYGNLTQRKF